MTETLPTTTTNPVVINEETTTLPAPPVPPPPPTKHKSSLAPFNPTCNQAMSTTLNMLKLTSNDVLFDLGCGDGRMLLHAAQATPGLRCVGIELDPVFVKRGRETLQALPESVQTRVDLRRGNLIKLMDEMGVAAAAAATCISSETENQDPMTANPTTPGEADDDDGEFDPDYSKGILGKECRDLSLFKDATALYLFILPKGIQRIQGLLDALLAYCQQTKRPLRVVSYMFSVREWEPVLIDKTTKGDAPLYLYQFFQPIEEAEAEAS